MTWNLSASRILPPCSYNMVATLATIPGRFGHDNVIRYCSQAMGVPVELRCRRPCQILRQLFLGSLAGELVGPLVFRMAGMTFDPRSEEHTSELQSLMRVSYAVFCLKKK